MEWEVPKASISRLDASYEIIGGDLIGVLVDEIKSPCSYNISNVALVDAIFLFTSIKHPKIMKIQNLVSY
jgi:hypothetical protein